MYPGIAVALGVFAVRRGATPDRNPRQVIRRQRQPRGSVRDKPLN
jgi:hypothetical protein